METVTLPATHDFLLGGGEMGVLIRSIDWSSTPVGPIEGWPQSLRTSVSIMLNTHFPMYIAWGKEFTQFYNDGYRPILGSTKHPSAMGRSTRFTFTEIWTIIGPMFDGVMDGKAVGFTDFMLPMDRHGFTEECYFIFSYSPIKKEDGFTGGVLVTVTETSERVLGERRLKTLRELGDRTYQCKNLVDCSACIVQVLVNNKLDVPFSLLFSYDAGEKNYRIDGTTGIDSSRTVVSAYKLLSVALEKPLQAIPLQEIFDEIVFEDGSPWPEEPRYCCVSFLSRPDQTQGFGVLVLGVSPRLQYDHQYQNFFKLLNDQAITALSNANAFEEERRRAEALAEIDRAKTAFFSNISHEFRTPLTLMLGPLEELLRGNARLGEKDAENVEAAHRNALRLLRLVNALLDFSKIESGRIEAVFRPVDLKAFTRDIASNFSSMIEKAGLKLVTEFGDIPDEVYVDYNMWEKVLLNLLSNAFKYTLEGSIKITLSQHDGYVFMTVKDTGVGIPENELPHMFERFHRVVNSAGRTHEGTGIGLSLVSELVGIHHGSITAESKLGEGSIFTVKIPVGYSHLPAECVVHGKEQLYSPYSAESFAKEAAVFMAGESTRDSASTDASSRPTVLVVDDNGDMVRYLVRMLESYYSVATASNGKEALLLVRSRRPDLIISDIMMPVMDGVELMKRIKANADTADIPVVFLTARAGEESRIEGYETGADDYLVKPFSANELLARVKSQINISKTRSHISNLLKQVFEQTPAAITIIRRENYIVEFANDLYLKLVEKGKEFIGKSLFESLPELKDQFVPKLLDEVMTTGVPYEGRELELMLTRSGKLEKTYFNFIYHPLREQDGSITGVIVVCFEVTDLVIAKNRAEKSEALLEAKVKERTFELEQKNSLLIKANQELEQFAYVASHDLQEPLRKIRTFSSILQKQLPIDSHSKKYFDKIHSSSDRMAQLIKDVLNYSRLSNGQPSFVAVDLNMVLSGVLQDFELLIEETEAKVISGNLPVVPGHQLQLHQLFANLIGNALKFSDGKPIIDIAAKTISRQEMIARLPGATAESYVELTFRDNGIGFEQKFSSQIFTIFQRLHDKETTGTGIGLALCKKIVEIHHGFIHAESTPGEGAVFYVYLPLAQAQ